jgi:hypothetical protein
VEPKKEVFATNGRTLAHVQRARLVRGNTRTTNVASIKGKAKANPKASPKAKHATSLKIVDKSTHDSGERAVTTRHDHHDAAFQRTRSKSASFTLRANVPSRMTNALWYIIRLAGTSRVRANAEKETNVSFRIEAKKVFW